ncbi:MAG: hydrogenase maturation protease [Methanosarcinales archaeon]|nr:MAG: hydrogenase maturation protease [Methanosarcinales archaeon]
MKAVILCCGNPLAADDGFGISVFDELKKKELPENVQLICAGTAGLDLLFYIEGLDKVVIVDAIRSGREIGTIQRFTRDHFPEPSLVRFSLHELGLIDVIKAGDMTMQTNMPKDIVIIGVEIEKVNQIRWHVGLTPKVSQAIPSVVEMTLKEVFGGVVK